MDFVKNYFGIWKKTGDKSVQLVRGSFLSKYFLQNPYFRLYTIYVLVWVWVILFSFQIDLFLQIIYQGHRKFLLLHIIKDNMKSFEFLRDFLRFWWCLDCKIFCIWEESWTNNFSFFVWNVSKLITICIFSW